MDGEVNLKDSVYIQRYIAGWSGYTLTEQGKINADVNRDGKIEDFDANIISGYLAGNYSSLPVKITNTQWMEKSVPGMKLKYPSNWTVTEVNRNSWNYQQGAQSCDFEGYVGNAQVIVTMYEPEYRNIYDYTELMKQEAQKYGLTYNEFTGTTGYNLYNSDSEHLTWRELSLPITQGGMNSINLYNVSSIGWVTKINVLYYSSNQDEKVMVWKVLDEMIASIRLTSY